MTQYQWAFSTLIGEVLADPDLAHQDVFRRMLQAGLQDLVDAEATAKIGAARFRAHPGTDHPPQRHPPEDAGDPGRGGRPADPEAAGRVVLPEPVAPAAAGR